MKQNLFKNINVYIEMDSIKVDHADLNVNFSPEIIMNREFIRKGVEMEISRYLNNLGVILERTDKLVFEYTDQDEEFCELYCKIDNLVTRTITKSGQITGIELHYDITVGDTRWDI